MATPTYDLLESVTLATAASSVTFSSIDQSYGDLILSIDGEPTGEANLHLQLNSDSGNNYNEVRMFGNGSETSSSATDSSSYFLVGRAGLNRLQFADYSATDKHKSILARSDTTTYGYVWASALRWADTSAITSMLLYLSSDSFSAGSTFNLYGVAK